MRCRKFKKISLYWKVVSNINRIGLWGRSMGAATIL